MGSTRRAPAPRRVGSAVLITILVVMLTAVWTLNFVFLTESPAKLRAVEPVPSPVTVAPPPPAKTAPNYKTELERKTRSVLHPRVAVMPPPQGPRFSVSEAVALKNDVVASTETFAQYGTNTRGRHYRLRNHGVLRHATNKKDDSVLVVVVLNNHRSWGTNRTSSHFFELLTSFTHPKAKTSLTMLVSDMDEYDLIQQSMLDHIHEYAQFSLLFRNDFDASSGLTRDNRHDDAIQNVRRRIIARYRNFALLSTLESWHQHVVWLDADVHVVPATLVATMVAADRDILEPLCYAGKPPSTEHEYDLNAWVGVRKEPPDMQNRKGFVPGDADVRHMGNYRNDASMEFMPLDSVGGTMLYVRADIHRQGVLFAHHYVIGSEWTQEGYDGIETEGLCYSAHFLGFKCWGMPHQVIYHE